MSEENKVLPRRLLEELFGQGNLDIVDEIVDANYVGHDPDSPQEMHGPEGVNNSPACTSTLSPISKSP